MNDRDSPLDMILGATLGALAAVTLIQIKKEGEKMEETVKGKSGMIDSYIKGRIAYDKLLEMAPKLHPHDSRIKVTSKRFWSMEIKRERLKARETFYYYDRMMQRLREQWLNLSEMKWYNRIVFLFVGKRYAVDFCELVTTEEWKALGALVEKWEEYHREMPVEIANMRIIKAKGKA